MRLPPGLSVALGYLAVALACSWPLPLHLGTHLTGDPGGDTGVYVWNQWVFQQEAVERHNPLGTGRILSLTDRVDLSQHNYTAFLGALAMPLTPLLGVVTTFNVVLLLMTVLTAALTYRLVREVTPATRLEAWLAGVVFAWSPILVARTTGHFSLVAAAPLPAFLLCLVRANRTRHPRDAALAGLAMAWAAFCDAYFAVYCLLIAGVYLASRLVRVSRAEGHAARRAWVLDVLIVCVLGLVAGLLVGRGGRVEILGITLSMRGLYTPMLLLTVLVLARVLVWAQPRIAPAGRIRPASWGVVAVGVLACAGPLAPVLYGLGTRVADGRLVSPAIHWRSSPRGVDLLAFVDPNPNHPLARAALGDQQAAAPTVFVEYVAAFSLVALVVIAVAWGRRLYRPATAWLAVTLGFALLALGPFIYVAGVNTHIPGPWALLRYVPLVGAARTPTRLAIVAALGLAVLFAGALAALGARAGARRTRLAALVGVLLVVELLPAPRPLFSAAIPSFYERVAADPRPVRVLELPFGVRDGVSSAGDFSARSLFHQTRHGKPLIGGYLSRISARRLARMREKYDTIDALVRLSEGQGLPPGEDAAHIARGRRFAGRARIGWIVIDHERATPALVDYATRAFTLVEVAREGRFALYRPRLAPVPTTSP